MAGPSFDDNAYYREEAEGKDNIAQSRGLCDLGSRLVRYLLIAEEQIRTIDQRLIHSEKLFWKTYLPDDPATKTS